MESVKICIFLIVIVLSVPAFVADKDEIFEQVEFMMEVFVLTISIITLTQCF